MLLNGSVLDDQTNMPVAYANVSIVTESGDSGPLLSTSADSQGFFQLNGYQVSFPNYLAITAAEYESIAVPVTNMSKIVIKMKRKVKELDEVIIHSGPNKSNYAWLLLIPLAVAATSKKKSVGEIGFNVPTVLTAGALFLLVKGGGLVNSLLSALGLSTDKDDRDFTTENSNPTSPLKSEIYLKATAAQKNAVQLSLDATKQGETLIDSFGAFNDDEAQAISVFKKFKSQLESSYFAYVWEDWGYPDLLQWLKGDGWPNDRLDTGEINEILKYLKNLPKY